MHNIFQKLRRCLYRLLRKSQRYTKTDMVYLTRGGFWLSLSYGVAVLSGFLISIAFANLFPKESFGTYKFILSVAGIIGAFSLTGIGQVITRAVAHGFGDSLRQGFRVNLKWSIGMLVGGSALSAYYYLNNNTLLSLSFLLIGIFLPVTTSANLYSDYLLGKKDFIRNSLYGMIRNVMSAAALILALFLTESLPAIITVYFVFGALVSMLLYRTTASSYQHENGKEDPGLVSYGGHLSAMEIIGRIATYLDKILIFHYLGAVPLAIYAFAIAPVEQLQAGKKILGTLALPKASERPFEELQKTAPRKALLLIIYALGLAGLYSLFAPYFYKLFFPQYLDSVFYSQIYSFTLLAIAGSVLQQVLVAHKKKKELYLQRTIVPVIQIVLYFIFLPLFGLMGLIATHVIMRSFSSLLAYYFVRHPLKE